MKITVVDPRMNESLVKETVTLVRDGKEISVPRIDPNPMFNGCVVRSRRNPEWLSMVLANETVQVSPDGLINVVVRQVNIRHSEENMKKVFEKMDFHPGDDFSGKMGTQFKIVVVEQLTPHFPDQSPKINPQSRKVLLNGDSPIYRKNKLLPESDIQSDHFIPHTGEGVLIESFVQQSKMASAEKAQDAPETPAPAPATPVAEGVAAAPAGEIVS